MLLPHKTFIDMWEESLSELGPLGRAAKFQLWPTGGVRPAWWDSHWKDSWPFDKASKGTNATTQGDRGMESTSSGGQWLRLGPRGDNRHPGEPRTNLNQNQPWILVPDSGILPTRNEKHANVP
jgi:hypothetical protein